MKQQSTWALAAKQIKNYMKANNIVGSVTSESYSMGSCVRVYVEDLPPAISKQLEEFAKQYQYGNFNGMEDLYEYSNNRKDIPQVKYVFVNNKPSDEMRQKIWDFARGFYTDLSDAPADVKEASLYRNVNMQCYGDQIIWRLYSAGYMDSQFWEFYLPKQEAA